MCAAHVGIVERKKCTEYTSRETPGLSYQKEMQEASVQHQAESI